MDKRDKTWAEFSTLEVAVLMQCSHVKPRNFKLKTQPKQLIGPFPLDIEQPGRCLFRFQVYGRDWVHQIMSLSNSELNLLAAAFIEKPLAGAS